MRDIMRMVTEDPKFEAVDGKKRLAKGHQIFDTQRSDIFNLTFPCGQTTTGIKVHDHRLTGYDSGWEYSVKKSPNGKYVFVGDDPEPYDPEKHGLIDKTTWFKEGDTVPNMPLIHGYRAIHDHRGEASVGNSCTFRSEKVEEPEV